MLFATLFLIFLYFKLLLTTLGLAIVQLRLVSALAGETGSTYMSLLITFVRNQHAHKLIAPGVNIQSSS